MLKIKCIETPLKGSSRITIYPLLQCIRNKLFLLLWPLVLSCYHKGTHDDYIMDTIGSDKQLFSWHTNLCKIHLKKCDSPCITFEMCAPYSKRNILLGCNHGDFRAIHNAYCVYSTQWRETYLEFPHPI